MHMCVCVCASLGSTLSCHDPLLHSAEATGGTRGVSPIPA